MLLFLRKPLFLLAVTLLALAAQAQAQIAPRSKLLGFSVGTVFQFTITAPKDSSIEPTIESLKLTDNKDDYTIEVDGIKTRDSTSEIRERYDLAWFCTERALAHLKLIRQSFQLRNLSVVSLTKDTFTNDAISPNETIHLCKVKLKDKNENPYELWFADAGLGTYLEHTPELTNEKRETIPEQIATLTKVILPASK